MVNYKSNKETVASRYCFNSLPPYALSDFEPFYRLLERESIIYGLKLNHSEILGSPPNIKRLLDKWNMGGLPKLIIKDGNYG